MDSLGGLRMNYSSSSASSGVRNRETWGQHLLNLSWTIIRVKKNNEFVKIFSVTPSGGFNNRCTVERYQKTKKRILKILLVTTLEFLLCGILTFTVHLFSYSTSQSLNRAENSSNLHQLTAHASCCCQPMNLWFMNSYFREESRRRLSCSKPSRVSTLV